MRSLRPQTTVISTFGDSTVVHPMHYGVFDDFIVILGQMRAMKEPSPAADEKEIERKRLAAERRKKGGFQLAALIITTSGVQFIQIYRLCIIIKSMIYVI